MHTSPAIGLPMSSVPCPASAIDDAIAWLERSFPFEGYLHLGTGAQRSIAELVAQRVPAQGEILDIGCGPCDKTAVLSRMGYRCTGIDDFGDPWHREGQNLARIGRFARSAGVDLLEGDGHAVPFEDESFDAVLACDVIEHLHASPRALLERALGLLREGGWLVLSVPNAVNLRKRLDVIRGRTNYPPYRQFFESDTWRGHVREYVWDDLVQLATFLGLEEATVHGRHHMLGVLPRWAQLPYRALTAHAPALRDSLVLCGRKPQRGALSEGSQRIGDPHRSPEHEMATRTRAEDVDMQRRSTEAPGDR